MSTVAKDVRNATVLEILPNARFLCALEDGAEVRCHVSGDMRLQVVRVLPGDTVQVEVSPLDPGKGRIVVPPKSERTES